MLASTSRSRFALLCAVHSQWPSLAYRGQCRSLRVSWQESRPLTVPKQVSDFGLRWTQVCGECGQWPTADSLWPRQGLGPSSGPWLKLARWCYPRCLFEVPSIKTSTTSVAERCPAAPERTVIVWSNKRRQESYLQCNV